MEEYGSVMESVPVKKPGFWEQLKFPLYFVVLLWAIHITSYLSGYNDVVWGIYPRTTFGLKGILFSPLIHANFKHLISNTVPMLVLGSILNYFYPRVALRSFWMIYLLTGVAVWLFARPGAFHIGASGVVYGLVAFIFWSGIFRRNLRSIVLAAIVTLLYSGMIVGILPNEEGVSWESHLMGGFVGIFTAYFYKEAIEEEERPELRKPEIPEEKQHFLDRDVFDQTRAERQQQQQQKGGNWFSDWTG